MASYGNPPLLFVENRGQVAGVVRYYLPGGDRTIYLTDDAIWVTVREAAPAPLARREVLASGDEKLNLARSARGMGMIPRVSEGPVGDRSLGGTGGIRRR